MDLFSPAKPGLSLEPSCFGNPKQRNKLFISKLTGFSYIEYLEWIVIRTFVARINKLGGNQIYEETNYHSVN